MNKIKVLIAPNLELAKSLPRPEATVEAEYGDFCVEGSVITLAHHGSRSANPAPCNTENVPILKEGVIMISHIDLDTLGGIFAIMGQKIDAPEFWKGAEFVDVQGIHHIHELPQNIQDQMNAFYAYKDTVPKVRYTEVTDVTDKVEGYRLALIPILDSLHPDHERVIHEGIAWEAASSARVESNLVKETEHVRCFSTDGIFCAAAYYSPKQKKVFDATVTKNMVYHTITVAFADGGKTHNACAIVQKLWGSQAGGRAGIAGSPRSWGISDEQLEIEFEKCCRMVEEQYTR